MSEQCKQVLKGGRRCKNSPLDESGYCRTHHPDAGLRPSTGSAFEENVLRVLRLLGYHVERNRTIHECQIDVYAEYRTGLITLRLMVECKELMGGKPVGIDEVKEFAGVLSMARGRAVDKGLMVTTNGFSREAKAFGAQAGIDLLTYSELSTQLMDFDSYLDKVKSEFERLPSYPYYVPLSGIEVEDYEGLDRGTFHRPLEVYLTRRWVDSQDSTRMALLGNFGTGKTTFCQKFAYDLARRFNGADPASRLPIVVSLSDYDSKQDIQELITNTLQFRYGLRGIDLSLSIELQRLGKFVILLDGFDEMAARVDPDVVRDNLRELSKLARIPENKILITCRTHFFRDKVQAEVLADFDMLYIPEWGEQELVEYLQKRFGSSWQKQLHKIQGTHNLTELAETPLFVEMITETLPQLGDEVTRTELYETYTAKWIQWQSSRRGARLDSAHRERLVHELAVKLYTEDKASCHYTELASVIRTHFATTDAAQMDYLQSDAQTCTFLVRNSAGNYGFRHKSFMEFFVAKSLARQLTTGVNTLLAARILPLDVRRFLVELLKAAAFSGEPLKDWLPHAREGVLHDNAISLLTDLKVDLSEVILEEDPDRDKGARVVTQFLQGDTKAFDIVLRTYKRPVLNIIRHVVSEAAVAEQLALDAFFRVWESRDRIDRTQEFQSYLFHVARRLAYDYKRRIVSQRWMEQVSTDAPGFNEIAVEDTTVQQVQDNETSTMIQKAIDLLPDSYRTVISLKYINGMTVSEIAKQTGMAPKRVQNLQFRALGELKRVLTELGYVAS